MAFSPQIPVSHRPSIKPQERSSQVSPNTSAPPQVATPLPRLQVRTRKLLYALPWQDIRRLTILGYNYILASKVDELVQEQRKRDVEIADLRQSLARKGEELKAEREMILKEVSEKICLLEQNLKHEVSSEEKTTLNNCLSWTNRHMKANHQRNATIIISLVVLLVTMRVLFYY